MNALRYLAGCLIGLLATVALLPTNAQATDARRTPTVIDTQTYTEPCTPSRSGLPPVTLERSGKMVLKRIGPNKWKRIGTDWGQYSVVEKAAPEGRLCP